MLADSSGKHEDVEPAGPRLPSKQPRQMGERQPLPLERDASQLSVNAESEPSTKGAAHIPSLRRQLHSTSRRRRPSTL